MDIKKYCLAFTSLDTTDDHVLFIDLYFDNSPFVFEAAFDYLRPVDMIDTVAKIYSMFRFLYC